MADERNQLIAATENGEHKAVGEILSSGKVNPNDAFALKFSDKTAPTFNATYFKYAVKVGNSKTVGIYLDTKNTDGKYVVDVNALSPDKTTAAMQAAYDGRDDLLTRILNRGANIKLKDKWNHDALTYANEGLAHATEADDKTRYNGVIERIKKQTLGQEVAESLSSGKNFPDTLKAALAAKVDLNGNYFANYKSSDNPVNVSLLYIAVEHNNIPAATSLIANGATPNGTGFDPVNVVKSEAMAKLLVDSKAKIELTTTLTTRAAVSLAKTDSEKKEAQKIADIFQTAYDTQHPKPPLAVASPLPEDPLPRKDDKPAQFSVSTDGNLTGEFKDITALEALNRIKTAAPVTKVTLSDKAREAMANYKFNLNFREATPKEAVDFLVSRVNLVAKKEADAYSLITKDEEKALTPDTPKPKLPPSDVPAKPEGEKKPEKPPVNTEKKKRVEPKRPEHSTDTHPARPRTRTFTPEPDNYQPQPEPVHHESILAKAAGVFKKTGVTVSKSLATVGHTFQGSLYTHQHDHEHLENPTLRQVLKEVDGVGRRNAPDGVVLPDEVRRAMKNPKLKKDIEAVNMREDVVYKGFEKQSKPDVGDAKHLQAAVKKAADRL